jgi:hypothetical protein
MASAPAVAMGDEDEEKGCMTCGPTKP